MYKKKIENFPYLNFENYFSGKVEAKGHLIQNYPSKKIKNLFVAFEGLFKNNTLKIKEDYYDQNSHMKRNWKFKKLSDNRYVGEEKNVHGNIDVSIKENHLCMKYIFRIVFWNTPIKIKIVDDMYLIDKKTIINTTSAYKYNIKLAVSYLIYKKLL